MTSLKSHLLPAACLLILGAALVASLPVAGATSNEDAEIASPDSASPDSASPDSASPDSASPDSASIERGRYIANDVAMCVQCHSPRNRRGELRTDRLFAGAPLPVKSPYQGAPRWAFTAPNLRNAPGYTEAEFLDFLMSGKRPNGTEARAPMPPYRMSREDAQAVYDYLMSY